MFPEEGKKLKKPRKSASGAEEDDAAPPEPVDVLVDTVIGFLEQATAYMRAVANQVFSLLSESVRESTIDLILAVRLSISVFDRHTLSRVISIATRAESSGGACRGRRR